MSSDTVMHPAVWPQYTWAETWGVAVPPFYEEELTQCGLGRVPHSYQVAS